MVQTRRRSTRCLHKIRCRCVAADRKLTPFYSTVDLVNELEKEKREGKAGRIALAVKQLARLC